MIPFVRPFFLSVEAVQRHIGRCPWYMLVGLSLWATACWTDTSFGVMSGMLLTVLGALCACCEKWQTEPGVWMLSGFWLLFYGTFYAIMFYHSVVEGTESAHLVETVEISMSTAILYVTVRFSASVMRLNWRYTRGAS